MSRDAKTTWRESWEAFRWLVVDALLYFSLSIAPRGKEGDRFTRMLLDYFTARRADLIKARDAK